MRSPSLIEVCSCFSQPSTSTDAVGLARGLDSGVGVLLGMFELSLFLAVVSLLVQMKAPTTAAPIKQTKTNPSAINTQWLPPRFTSGRGFGLLAYGFEG